MNPLQARSILSLRLWLVLLVAGVAVLGSRPHHAAAFGGDLLVVSIGDSIASGEGAPDVAKTSSAPAKWLGFSVPGSDPTTCHRSAKSGPQLAFNRIKVSWPSDTFVSVACSGAAITNGLISPQLYDNRTPKVAKSQLQLVKEWMAANNRSRIDLLLISAGANDAGFGDAVVKCADFYSLWATDCTQDSGFTSDMATKLDALGDHYDQLSDALQQFTIGSIYLTEYHDPLHKPDGSVCNAEPKGDQLDRVSGIEAQWLLDHLFTPLNDKARQATLREPQRHVGQVWTFVDRIAAEFAGHAYCTTGRWANTDRDSKAKQDDHYGIVHPNATGYQHIAAHIASRFLDCRNCARFVSWTNVPASLTPGQQATVSVTMQNIGTATWVAGGATAHRLGSQNPQDNTAWGTGRVYLAGDVAPGGTVTFTFTITAPATPGIYHFQWRMVQEFVEWFGEFTPDVAITVATPPAAPSTLKDTVTVSGSLYKHTLSWTLNSTNQTSVVVNYQDDSTTTWNTITMPTATTTQFMLDSRFKLGHGYFINVQACFGSVCSAASNTIWVDIASTL